MSDKWLVENLRLTAFSMEPFPPEQDSWWESVVGEPPETVVSNPRILSVNQSGAFGDGALSLTIRPTRADWVWHASAPGADDYPQFGEFDALKNEFIESLSKWLSTDLHVSRIALGASLILPTNDSTAGLSKIKELVHLDLDLSNCSDFSIQINRPRKFEIGSTEFTVNRLANWSVQIFRKMHIDPIVASGGVVMEDKTGCRLVLDVNTSADSKTDMPAELLKDVPGKLLTLATEIAEKGDCK